MGRIGDVLQLLLPQIDELGGNRSSDVTPGVSRDADPAWCGETFEPCRKVDPMAVDVIRRDDDVTEVDAHAELDPMRLRQFGIPRDHGALHFEGAAHGVDDTAEFDESAVSGALDDPATMLADLRRDDLAPIAQQTPMRAFLVAAHQMRIADDVCDKDRRQPALEARMTGRSKAPPQLGRQGRQPLNEDGPAPGQHSGDPGFAYLRPQLLQHDPASFDRRDPPGIIGQKSKSPVRVRRGPGNRPCAQSLSANEPPSAPCSGSPRGQGNKSPTSKSAPFGSSAGLYARLGALVKPTSPREPHCVWRLLGGEVGSGV